MRTPAPCVALLLFLLPLTALPLPVAAVPVAVEANQNIYGAGHLVAPGPGGNGGGVLPVEVPIPPGADRVATFALGGTVDYGTCCPANGPDGIVITDGTVLPQYDGLAGCDVPERGRFLSGVFLDDSEPADPPPAHLVFVDGWYSDNSGLVTGTVTFGSATDAPVVGREAALRLERARPNPFATSTAVRFTLRSADILRLDVHDVVGRRVRTLLDERRGPGTYVVRWDGRDETGRSVPAGVYWLRLTGESGTRAGKVARVR